MTGESVILTHCKLIIVDDDVAIRNGLRRIAEASGAEVVAEANNGRSGIEQAKSFDPELILLDITMPVMGGFAAARELRRTMPKLRIVFVSQHNDRVYAEEALQMGAAGYVLKGTAVADLENALTAAMAGRTFVSPSVGGHVGAV